MTDARQAGLRLQIVLALAGLMLLAFVPLFFAVASLTRATVLGAREQSARALGRAIAAHVARRDGERRRRARSSARSRATRGGTRWTSVCVFGPAAGRLACAGSPADAADDARAAVGGVRDDDGRARRRPVGRSRSSRPRATRRS